MPAVLLRGPDVKGPQGRPPHARVLYLHRQDRQPQNLRQSSTKLSAPEKLLQKEAAKVGVPSRQFGVGGGGLQHAHCVAQLVSGVEGFPAKLEYWFPS